MDSLKFPYGGRFFVVTNKVHWQPEKQETEPFEDDNNFADEEIQHEQFVDDAQSEQLMVDDIPDDNGPEINGDDQWPLPPEEKASNLQPKLSAAKSDPVLYTSFLTIDVSSSKTDSLNVSQFEDRHRASLLNLVTGSRESVFVPEFHNIDKDDMVKIKHDLEMICKYLHSMPLAASLWPQNYDVLRDLVKLYLAAKNSNTTFLTYLLDNFLKLDWPGIFLKCLRKIMDNYPQVFIHSADRKIPFEDPTPEVLDMTQVSMEYAVAVIFQVILSLAAEFTEVHNESQQTGHQGFIKFIFFELLPKLHGIQWEKNTAREEFLLSVMDIIYNFSQSSCNIPCFYECNAVESLIMLRRETENIGGNRVNIGSLMALSFLIDERNNHLILSDPAQISLLIHYIEECFSKIDHCYADFNVAELIEGLTRIASNDRNKLTICKYGGISSVMKVLRKATDDEERIAILNLLWSLCFMEKCKQKILCQAPEIVNIAGKQFQTSNNKMLSRTAEFLVWELEDKFEDHGSLTEPEIEHILISCHPEQRDAMAAISEKLKEKGYRVQMEENLMKSTPEVVVAAVENAAAVLIGVSRKYKQTPSCFAVAEYAFQLRKHMIPITVERNYKPDGWLGMLSGSKVWLDFTDDTKFDGHIQILSRQLGDRGKAERAVNILYIDDHHPVETNGHSAENRLIDISRWSNEEVLEWLAKNNLKDCVADEMKRKLRGSHLIRLHHLRKESPDFYYNSLEPQLGFTDVIDMMEFTQALEALTECV